MKGIVSSLGRYQPDKTLEGMLDPPVWLPCQTNLRYWDAHFCFRPVLSFFSHGTSELDKKNTRICAALLAAMSVWLKTCSNSLHSSWYNLDLVHAPFVFRLLKFSSKNIHCRVILTISNDKKVTKSDKTIPYPSPSTNFNKLY